MKRKIEQKLLDWKNSRERMPLIMNGARQIGKTYSILEFGKKNFRNTIHVNLETDTIVIDIFEKNISPEYIVNRLEAVTGEVISKQGYQVKYHLQIPLLLIYFFPS